MLLGTASPTRAAPLQVVESCFQTLQCSHPV